MPLHVSDDFMNTALSRALAPAFTAPACEEARTQMSARLDYRWHLRKVMADRGMFSTTDLIGPLAERGITLSSSQVYRLVVERPERLSLKILMALLDILDCTMDDLIEPVAAASAGGGPGRPPPAGPGTLRASVPGARSGPGSPACSQ